MFNLSVWNVYIDKICFRFVFNVTWKQYIIIIAYFTYLQTKRSLKKEKLIKPKKVKEPVEQPEPEVKLTKTGKVKKEVTPERREQLRLQLEKGRKTRSENFARKKAEKAKLVEEMKIKIAEPVIKETIIKEKKTKKPKKVIEYVSDSSSSSSEEEVIVKKKSKAKKQIDVKIPQKIPTQVFQFV